MRARSGVEAWVEGGKLVDDAFALQNGDERIIEVEYPAGLLDYIEHAVD